MYISVFVWFPAGGRLNPAENVTEEVQSLRNRVELLEKVHTCFKHEEKPPPPTHPHPDTSQPGSPGAPLVLVLWYEIKIQVAFSDSLKCQTLKMGF